MNRRPSLRCASTIQRQPWGVTALQYPHDQPAALSLSAMISQYFIGGMMPQLANPVQQPQTIIEIRPYRGGWQCFEGPGRRTALDWREREAECYRIMPKRAPNLGAE